MRPESLAAGGGARVADRRQRGATLIELVVSIVVISIALTGTLLVVDTTTRRSADPLLEHQALTIAGAYLEEIAGQAYLDPDTNALCGPVEATRDRYDDLCDYHGLDDVGARDRSGAPVAGLDAYRIQVAIDQSVTLGGLTDPNDAVRIDVTVTDPTGRPLRLSAYRTNP